MYEQGRSHLSWTHWGRHYVKPPGVPGSHIGALGLKNWQLLSYWCVSGKQQVTAMGFEDFSPTQKTPMQSQAPGSHCYRYWNLNNERASTLTSYPISLLFNKNQHIFKKTKSLCEWYPFPLPKTTGQEKENRHKKSQGKARGTGKRHALLLSGRLLTPRSAA